MDLLFPELQGTEDPDIRETGFRERLVDPPDPPSHPRVSEAPPAQPGPSAAPSAELLPMWALFQEHVAAMQSKMLALEARVDSRYVSAPAPSASCSVPPSERAPAEMPILRFSNLPSILRKQ